MPRCQNVNINLWQDKDIFKLLHYVKSFVYWNIHRESCESPYYEEWTKWFYVKYFNVEHKLRFKLFGWYSDLMQGTFLQLFLIWTTYNLVYIWHMLWLSQDEASIIFGSLKFWWLTTFFCSFWWRMWLPMTVITNFNC